MAGNNALLMGRFVRAAPEAYANAALVDVANFHAPRIDGRRNDDPKMLDAIIGDIGKKLWRHQTNLNVHNPVWFTVPFPS